MPPRRTPAVPDTPVEALWNLSDLTAGWLRAHGVETHADLARRDLVELWIALRLEHEQVTRLMYYALWGALHDQHWKHIPEAEKARLDAELERRGFPTGKKRPAKRRGRKATR